MKATMDIFARVYDRISKSIQDINVQSVRENSGKVMDLLLGVPSLKAFADDAKTMISLVKDFRTGEYRDISWATIGAILFAFIYLVAPFDIIFDAIPVIGMLDDVVIFRIALAFIQDDLQQYADWKRNAHIPEAELVADESEDMDEAA